MLNTKNHKPRGKALNPTAKFAMIQCIDRDMTYNQAINYLEANHMTNEDGSPLFERYHYEYTRRIRAKRIKYSLMLPTEVAVWASASGIEQLIQRKLTDIYNQYMAVADNDCSSEADELLLSILFGLDPSGNAKSE